MQAVQNTSSGSFNSNDDLAVKFTVSQSPELIRNLITSAYKNGPETVTRELKANAWDSHSASGKPLEPIHVSLPVSLDSTLIVRDFGTGMSHSFVMEQYSSLGTSSKTQDNSQTGAFGIGSKSPLSISDSFTIRCFDKPCSEKPFGQVRCYTVGYSDDGMPQVVPTFTARPKESDKVELGGTEVRVPIKPDDRRKIVEGVAKQHLCWFDKPIVWDGTRFIRDEELTAYSTIDRLHGNIFTAKRRSGFSGTHKSTQLRQGSAVYPLDMDKVVISSTHRTLINNFISYPQSLTIMFDVPLGTTDVTMSREEIRYNETSIANISAFITTEIQAIEERLEKLITDDIISFEQAIKVIGDEMYPELSSDPKNLYTVQHKVERYVHLVRRKLEKNYQNLVTKLTADTGQYPNPPVLFEPFVSMLNIVQFPLRSTILNPAYLRKKSADVQVSRSDTMEIRPNCFAYVLPRTLKNYSDLVKVHLKGLQSSGLIEIANEDIRVSIPVIRTNRTNIAETIAFLKSKYPHIKKVYTEDVLEKPVKLPREKRERIEAYTYNITTGKYDEPLRESSVGSGNDDAENTQYYYTIRDKSKLHMTLIRGSLIFARDVEGDLKNFLVQYGTDNSDENTNVELVQIIERNEARAIKNGWIRFDESIIETLLNLDTYNGNFIVDMGESSLITSLFELGHAPDGLYKKCVTKICEVVPNSKFLLGRLLTEKSGNSLQGLRRVYEKLKTALTEEEKEVVKDRLARFKESELAFERLSKELNDSLPSFTFFGGSFNCLTIRMNFLLTYLRGLDLSNPYGYNNLVGKGPIENSRIVLDTEEMLGYLSVAEEWLNKENVGREKC
jgi:hypothetical protein